MTTKKDDRAGFKNSAGADGSVATGELSARAAESRGILAELFDGLTNPVQHDVIVAGAGQREY
jgi:hypothetical protein